MEGKEGCSAKVGAGETAACHQCGRPFALALGETSARQCPGGLAGRAIDKETAEWLAPTMSKMRERDQAALARDRLRHVLVFVSGVVLGGVLVATYFMEALK